MSISLTHSAISPDRRINPGVGRIPSRPAIRRTILLAFVCIGLLTGGLGSYAIYSIVTAGRLTDQAIEAALTSIGYARSASGDFKALAAATARRRALPNQVGLAAQITTLAKTLDENLGAVAQRASTPQTVQAAAAARTAIADWSLAGEMNTPEGYDSTRMDAVTRIASRRLERLVDQAAGAGLQSQERARIMLAHAKSQLLLGTCGALIMAGLIAILTMRRIVGLIVDRRASPALSSLVHPSPD